MTDERGWIECGLPWAADDRLEHVPPYPDFSAGEREEFGVSRGAAADAACPFFERFSKVERMVFPRQEDLYGAAAEDRELAVERWTGDPELALGLSDADREAVALMLAYRRLSREIDAWRERQPELAAWRAAAQAAIARREDGKRRSFCGQRLNRPGVLVEVEADGEVKQLLIGHVSRCGGECEGEACVRGVVRRYRIVWDAGS